MRIRGGLRVWGAVSAALHALVLALILLDLAARRFEEPREQAVAVELVSAEPAQQAEGAVPAPRPAPEPVPRPPTPEPPVREPPRVELPQPPPPPPPPPPAPAPAPVQQAQPQPRPAPPAPPPEPVPAPVRPPQQVAQAPTPPTPQQATPAPPRPQPPVPLPPSPVRPPPEPARETPGTGQTPPPPRPQERSQSVLNTLERLRQQQPQDRPPSARPSPPAGAPAAGGGAPTGAAQLTAGEIRGLAEQIGECWNVDAGMVGLSDIVVTLRVQLDGQGNVRNVVPAGGAPSDPRARSVYESARRALLAPQCNPLKVPNAKLETVMASTFRFNPRGLVR